MSSQSAEVDPPPQYLTRMKTGFTALTVWAVTLAVAYAAPVNRPVSVHVHIKGPRKVVFDGIVVTRGHTLTTKSGGTHQCDGTNNDAHRFPGPTVNSALDDVARTNRFSIDGPWFPEFEDYLINTIAGIAGDSTHFWSAERNGKVLEVGGCQEQIADGDKLDFRWMIYHPDS